MFQSEFPNVARTDVPIGGPSADTPMWYTEINVPLGRYTDAHSIMCWWDRSILTCIYYLCMYRLCTLRVSLPIWG